MPDTLNQSAATHHAILVEFLWGAGLAHVARYTNWTDQVTIGSAVYDAAPSTGPKIETRIQVEPSAQTGGVKDEPWNLIMPPVVPLTYLIRPCVWAPVTCNISEVDPTAISPSPTQLWSGIITKAWKNPKGAPGCIKAEVSGYRVRVQYPLGVESKTSCIRIFGDAWCGKSLGPLTQTAVITAVAGKTIAAPSLTFPRANYWSFGRVSVDGLIIGIADGSAGVSTLKLLQTPPPEWVGATATFIPGCDHTKAGCALWNNTARYAGFGQRKPSASPSISPR